MSSNGVLLAILLSCPVDDLWICASYGSEAFKTDCFLMTLLELRKRDLFNVNWKIVYMAVRKSRLIKSYWISIRIRDDLK